MEKYTQHLNNLTWKELMQQIATIILRDEKTLENNVNYYKKLFNDAGTDKTKLNNLFEKLQLDKLRYAYFSELFIRLEVQNYKLIIMSLESCIQQETQLQNKSPKDWTATITFQNGQIKIYFMALSYYQ